MSRLRYVSLVVVIGSIAFLATVVARTRGRPGSTADDSWVSSTAPESLQLAALGLRPGKQLVAFVFGGSACGYCNSPETKAAYASIRDSLRARIGGEFRSVRVVGVAINTNLTLGLEYLSKIGLQNFDEISTGSGWQNENVTRLIRRNQLADEAVPLVVVLSRPVSAKLNPLAVSYGSDSIVLVLQGQKAVTDWIRSGALLDGRVVTPRVTTTPFQTLRQ